MELKSTGDFRECLNSLIYDRRTNVSKVAKEAGLVQSALASFTNGKTGTNLDTLFLIAPVFGKKILFVDEALIITIDVNALPDNRTLKDVLDEMQQKLPMCVITQKDKSEVIKDFLLSIKEYKANNDPDKPKFSEDFIEKLLEKAFDN